MAPAASVAFPDTNLDPKEQVQEAVTGCEHTAETVV